MTKEKCPVATDNTPDSTRTVSRCVETENGAEVANINLGTGEITYTKTDGTCTAPETTFGKLTPKK